MTILLRDNVDMYFRISQRKLTDEERKDALLDLPTLVVTQHSLIEVAEGYVLRTILLSDIGHVDLTNPSPTRRSVEILLGVTTIVIGVVVICIVGSGQIRATFIPLCGGAAVLLLGCLVVGISASAARCTVLRVRLKSTGAVVTIALSKRQYCSDTIGKIISILTNRESIT